MKNERKNQMKNWLIGMVLALLVSCGVVHGGISEGRYYTWGIDPNIATGSVPTDVTLTIEGQGNVQVYLVDSPPLGFVRNAGPLAASPARTVKVGDMTITYSGTTWTEIYSGPLPVEVSLGTVDVSSWADSVFDAPFTVLMANNEPRVFNSALLEFIDYIGNGTPGGFLVQAGTVTGMSLSIRVESYEGTYRERIINLSAMVFDWVQWANEQRVALGQQIALMWAAMEARIAAAQGAGIQPE